MMNLKFGFIGIGNAGNQVINLLHSNGLEAEEYTNLIAINSSEKDLSTLHEDVPWIMLGKLGCAKERTLAKDYVKKEYKSLIKHELIIELMNTSDVIFIISSAGGGTGSGMSPILTNVLKSSFKNKVIINICIFPDNNSDMKAFANSLEYIKEIKDQGLPLIPYSNEKALGNSLKDRMNYVNHTILEDIKSIMGYYTAINENSMIDERDLLKLINTSGIMTVTRIDTITEKDLDNKPFDKIVLDAVNNSPIIELDKDRIQKRIAFILNVSDNIYNKIDRSYSDIKSELGTPLDIFENLGDDEEKNSPSIIFIRSGLSYSNELIDFYNDKVSEVNKLINNTKVIDETKFDILDSFKDESFNIGDTDEQTNVDDINFEELDDLVKGF